MSPADFPWWGWLLFAAVAGCVYGFSRDKSAGLGARSAWALLVCFVSAWTALLTAAIGITQMSHFWQSTILVGLVLVAVWGAIENSGELRKVESKLDRILEHLESNKEHIGKQDTDCNARGSRQGVVVG
jgi:hypothetical protein